MLLPGIIQIGSGEKDKKLARMVEGLRRAVKYEKEKGIDVALEDFDGIEAPYCTIAGMEYFMNEVPGLKCAFDTGNFVMYEEDEIEAFEKLKDRICTLHLKDRSKTKK